MDMKISLKVGSIYTLFSYRCIGQQTWNSLLYFLLCKLWKWGSNQAGCAITLFDTLCLTWGNTGTLWFTWGNIGIYTFPNISKFWNDLCIYTSGYAPWFLWTSTLHLSFNGFRLFFIPPVFISWNREPLDARDAAASLYILRTLSSK